MTRPSFPTRRFVLACFFLAGGPESRLRAAHSPASEAAHAPETTPAAAPAPGPIHVPEMAPADMADAAMAFKVAVPPDATTRAAPVVSHQKDEVRSLLTLGPSLTERGDFEAGEIAFRQVMTAPGVALEDVKTALLGLARLHRKQGALTKAVAIYERYLKEYPGDERSPDVLLDLGRSLRALGSHKLAINRFYSVLNSTLKLTGESFVHYQLVAKTAQFEIAQTHFEAGNFADANKYFTRLRLLDLSAADRARAHFMSAYSLRLQGDRDGAVTALRTFIAQSPEDENLPEARYLLAITLRELQRPQEAFNATLELLRAEKTRTGADPKLWSYWQRRTGNQLANDFFENGDTANAQAIYAGLLDLSVDPNWRLPLSYQIGLCYERLGAIEQARNSYQGIVTSAGATPPAELAELARMAAWRLEHLNWRENVERQLGAFFNTTTGRQVAAVPPAPAKTAPAP